MQVTETLSDGLKRAFAVVVPAADIETRRASRLSELAKQVNLPGFRPGKVPMPIVRQRFGGAVAAEVLEQTINETTQQLLSERDLRPAVMPKLEMVTQEPTAIGPAKDLEFTLELELLPEIPMPDFSTFTLTRHVARVPTEEVDKAVADIAERNRDLVELSPEDLGWRFHFLLGAMIYTMADSGRIQSLTDGQCDAEDVQAVMLNIVPFLAAGFRSPPLSRSVRRRPRKK